MHKIFGKPVGNPYTHRTGAYLIPIKDNQIAVIKTKKGLFFLGGGIEPGETDEACIARECREEIGYTVTVGKKICSAEAWCEHETIGLFHPIQSYYTGRLIEQTYVPEESDHELFWQDYHTLRGNMYTEMQNWALEQFIQSTFCHSDNANDKNL